MACGFWGTDPAAGIFSIMNNAGLKEELPCTFEDLAKLEAMMCKAKRELRFAGITVLILSVLLPFLPPKYSGSKAMLDIMSYGTAVSGILILMAVVFLWSIYYMLYGIHKDLKHKTKIRLTTQITSSGNTRYRGRNFFYISASGLPYKLARIPVTENESKIYKPGKEVTIEYSKFAKKLLGYEIK